MQLPQEKKFKLGCLGWGALIIVGIIILSHVIGNVSEASTSSDNNSSYNESSKEDPYHMVDDITIESVKMRWEYGGDGLSCMALVKNNSDKDLAVRVEFDLYDDANNLVTSDQSINTNVHSGSEGVVEWPFSDLDNSKTYNVKASVISTLPAY